MEAQFFIKHPYSRGMSFGDKKEVEQVEHGDVKVWVWRGVLDETKCECIAQMSGCSPWIHIPGGYVCIEFSDELQQRIQRKPISTLVN